MSRPTVPVLAGTFPPRVTMIIAGPTKTISETHWFNGSNQLAAAVLEAKTLGTLRQALLGSDASIEEVRCSLENVVGDSLLQPDPTNLAATKWGNSQPGDDNLLIRLEGTTLYRKSLFLSLLPDSVIVAGKFDTTAAPAYLTALQQYLIYLAQSGAKAVNLWGMLVRTKDPTIAPEVSILNIATNPGGTQATFTTNNDALLSVGDVILTRQVRDETGKWPVFNGLWVVDSGAFPSYTVTGTFPVSTTILPQAGFLRKQVKVWQAYTNSALRGISGHKRGQRTLLPLGRRRKPRVIVG